MVVFSKTAMLGEPGISQALYRAATAELEGMDPLIDTAMSRWFSESFRRNHPEAIHFYREMLAATPPLGYAASARAIAEMDLRSDLGLIQCPTLIIAGENDWSTPPAHHELIAQAIHNARLVVVKDAAHTISEEQPVEFNRLIVEFLNETYGPSEG